MVVNRSTYFLLPILIACLVVPAIFLLYPQKTNAQAATASCASSYIGGLLAPLATSLGLTTAGTAAATAGTAGQAAQAVVVVPVTNVVEGTQLAGIATANSGGNISTALTAGSAVQLSFKNCILTPLAEDMAARILANITSSLVNWIQSGFNGSPAFVTNMNDLLSNSADQAIGEYIQSDPTLSLLCQPFALKIRIALAIGFSIQQYQGCTLTQVTDNIKNFGNSFSAWNQWLDVTTVPENNQYGAYVQAEGILSDKINAELSGVNDEINRNGGFLDFQVCDQWEGQDEIETRLSNDPKYQAALASGDTKTEESINQPECTHTHTTTPGTTVEAALQASFNGEFTKIGLAQDIDQVIAALVNELVSATITGPGGLLGGQTSQPVQNNESIEEFAGTSNADTINALNNQAASSAEQEAASNQQLLTPPEETSTTSTSATSTVNTTTASFSNPYPSTNPVDVTPTSALPTYKVNVSLPQESNLQAVITLTSETGGSASDAIFDKSVYALYMGNSQGSRDEDTDASLLQNGIVTLTNVSPTVTSFAFDLRPLTGVKYATDTFDLTISIEDSSGNILATQVAHPRVLEN